MDQRDENLTTDEANALARAQALQLARTLRQVFTEVFGPRDKRTPHGQVVLDELERFAGSRRLVNETDSTGQTDIYRTGRKHGRCDVVQAIHDIIEWKEPSNANSS